MMKLVLLTNMPSYHQVDLGEALAERLGADNFRLVFAAPTSQARDEMGWDDGYSQPFILRLWQGGDTEQSIRQWIDEADVVVQGRFPMPYVRQRIKQGKLTFAYQERFWKRGFHWTKVILRLPRIYKRYWSVSRANHHLLAAGAYVAPDLRKVGCFRRRAWKFGYFIHPLPAPPTNDTASESRRIELLWCARFSPVKRVNDALNIVRGLQQRGVQCHLTLIGDGEMRAEIQASTEASELREIVTFAGWQGSDAVATAMRQADVLLMTSGFGEGWALVVNEAQRASCAVVANQDVGAAPWLIKDGENGLLYQQDQIQHLCERIATLSVDELRQMGQAAERTHRHQWSASVAAERLLQLSQTLLAGSPDAAQTLFADGPCSAA